MYAHGSGKFGLFFAETMIWDFIVSPMQSSSTWGRSTVWQLIFFISRTPQNKHYREK